MRPVALFSLLAALLLAAAPAAVTASGAKADDAARAAADKAAESAIRARLRVAMADAEITSVSPSPVSGLYEVVLDGGETAWVSADGQYLVSGELYRTTPRGLVNVSRERKAPQRRDALARVKPADLITFAAEGRERGVLYVFTDPDCGYCRRLHADMPALNKAGVTVHYLAFPRGGVDTATARKLDSAWCAADRRQAMNELKRGRSLPPAPAACRSPVADQYRLGLALGVRGTPATFTATGEQVGGYLPVPDLLAALGIK